MFGQIQSDTDWDVKLNPNNILCVSGTIECACTTAECKRDSLTSCTAENMCYVQYVALTSEDDDPSAAPVRGCIDEKTPLLCENRRPVTFTGSWPVLHCCKEDGCNKDVMPTEPAWLAAHNSEYIFKFKIITHRMPCTPKNIISRIITIESN